jgi:hypothetical protein
MKRKQSLNALLVALVALGICSCQCARVGGGASPVPSAGTSGTGSAGASPSSGSDSLNGQTPAASGSAAVPDGTASVDASSASASSTGGGAPAAQAKAPAAPSFETDPGPYSGDISVAIKVAEGTSVRYSLDGSVPGPKGGKAYAEPIPLEASTVVTAVAFREGKASRPAARTFTLKEVCVSPGGSGPGTRDRPEGSIAAAIQAAARLGIGSIKLAAGEYRETVEIKSSLAISGGWAAGFSKRGGTSAIVGASGGEKADAPRAAVSVVGAQGAAALSRLELRCSPAAYTAAISLSDGATAAVSDCSLSGGSGAYSYAARVAKKSSISLSSCQLSGGEGDTCVGLFVDSSNAKLLRCKVSAGSGSVVSYGVQCIDSPLLAASSAVYGGEANISYGIGLYALSGGSILGCTVHGGRGKTAYGLFFSASSPALKGSIVGAAGTSKSYGIYKNYGESSLSALEGNALWGSASGLYYDIDTKTAFMAMDSSGNPAGQGKVLAAPKGKGNIAWSGSIGADLATPADLLLSSKGIETDEAAATDIQGKKRTLPWTIGAYERD